MNQEQFWSEFSDLPPTAQNLVADFVRFLQVKYQTQPQEQTEPASIPIQDEPFIGMWENHSDLTDSTAFVRRLRTGEWGLAGE